MIGKAKFGYMNEQLASKLAEKAFLIVAHRGQWGGNIMENTINAAKVAKVSGAEIYEIDVCRSADGQFFAFHTGNEQHLLGDGDLDLEQLTFAEIQELTLLNSLGAPLAQRFELIRDILLGSPKEMFSQIDRSWPYWDDFLPFLDSFDAELKQRMMIKSSFNDAIRDQLLASGTDLMFLPFIDTLAQFEELIGLEDVNLIGIEVLASDEEDELYGKAFIDRLHDEHQLIAQINAIRLNDKRKLYAGIDDNLSLLDGPDKGWGCLHQLGADLIQTDWVPLLNRYRDTL